MDSPTPSTNKVDVAKLLIADVNEKIEARCCWCDSKLIFSDKILVNGRPVAWCSGSKDCRKRQMANGCRVKLDGVVKWLFIPTPKQCEVMEASERNVFACGNRGGGKSVAIRWLCHQLATAIPGFRYAILRTSFPELNITHLSFLEHEKNMLGGEKAGFSYNKTEHLFYYPNGSMGIYAQCATDADVKKVLGAEVALVVFDEAPTFQWEHMRLINSSVRVPEGSGLKPMAFYLGNPVGPSIDDLWSYFVDKDVDPIKQPEYRPNKWRFIEIHIQDNPYLDKKTYWEDMAGLPEHILKAWRDGKRIDANAMFEIIEEKDGRPYHVIKELPRFGDLASILRQQWVRIYRAYDHGFDRDPAICLWFAVIGRRIILFNEQIWHRVIAKDIAKDIKAEGERLLGKNHKRPIMTYCDPRIDIKEGNEKTIKNIFEYNKVPMVCATNNREQYTHAIQSALKEIVDDGRPQLQILAEPDSLTGALGAPYTLKYLPRMTYDPDKPMRMADHKHDHGPVALAYFLMKHIPVTKKVDAPQYPEWWTEYFIAGTNIPRDIRLRTND
jgi:phage terminase large subunit